MPGEAWKKSLKKPHMYEGLREKGMSKERAAKISNASVHKSLDVDTLFAVAFSKSQLSSGEYVPITDIRRKKAFYQLQQDLKRPDGSRNLTRGPRYALGAPGRGIEDVYRYHGVGAGMEIALQEETRQSKVHPNVTYGSSIPPAMESKIDADLKADVARGARNPLVFHYGKLGEDSIAAATGGHQTTGGKGRIIINSTEVTPDGKIPDVKFASFGEMINHEAAHAIPKGKNPYRFLDYKEGLNQRKAFGEEARADARGVHGKGLYQRNSMVHSKLKLRFAQAAAEHMSPEIGAGVKEGLAGSQAYHRVHEAAQAAYGTKGSALRARGKAGAAVGGLAAIGALGVAGKQKWDERKHPRREGKFVSKALDVDVLFAKARGWTVEQEQEVREV